MSKKLFIDANVILDLFDNTRTSHSDSVLFYTHVLQNDYELYTSCDIITTLYYVNSKANKEQALLNVQNINKILTIIDFSNHEIEQTCKLMLQDSSYSDLEDTIQYILAKKLKCDFIISNDKNFISKDIKLLSSEKICRELNLK